MRQDRMIKNEKDSIKRRQQVSTVSTAALIVLMILYLIITVHSSVKLAEQSNIISRHPFEVVVSSGDAKLYVSEMGLRTERLLRHYNSSDIEHVRTSLQELYTSVEQPVSQIENQYMGPSEDVQGLKAALAKLKTSQDAFLEFVSSPEVTEAKIEAYQKEHLEPLYNTVLSEADDIITFAQERKVAYGENVDSLLKITLGSSVVLVTLMMAVLLISQYVMRRQRKELFYRSQLFDDLSSSIEDTFLIRDARTGTVSYCALNMERVLGATVTETDELYQGLTQEDAEEIRKTVQDPAFDFPYEKLVEYKKFTGEKRWMLIRIYRTQGAGSPQLISILSDRTEEILSRQALQDAMLSAEKANSAKSDFLSRMSHEIRTPLNAIIGMTAIAAAAVRDSARVEDCLTKIDFSSKHLLMLVNDILDMSKIEGGKMVLQEEPFDIFQVINGYVSTAFSQAKAKQIDFQETMEGFGEQTIYIGDSLRLNQILLNLSSNAVKFTEPGGKVRLNVTRIAAKSMVDVLRFTVTDTGIGMDRETVERIFKPFEQADASIAKRYGGTGLGMSITKNLVAIMNGRIQIESEPGIGTTCMVELPFRRGKENIEEPDFADQGISALIVDDEQQVCEQTVNLLEKIRIQAEGKLSGTEALLRVREAHRLNQHFDLCLIDWMMPDMDGIELTRLIRREVGDDVPIVLISAYDTSEIEREALSAGVNGFLPKPLYRSSVYTAVREALEGRHRPAADEGKKKEGEPLAGKRLLMAEDNELNREIAVELLTMSGAQIQCACDGKEALALFLESEPGCYNAVLMDVQMPVMDGHEAARRIRASGHPDALKIPIIATTANAFSDDISAALAAGMNAHVSKPLDIDKLCGLLAECIRRAEK